MTESSFGGDNDLTAGSTVQGEGEAVDSAAADREAAFNDPVRSGEGTIVGEDAVVANPVRDLVDDTLEPDRGTSADADVAAGHDDSDPDTARDVTT